MNNKWRRVCACSRCPISGDSWSGADPVKVVLGRYTSGDELVSVHDNAPFPEILQTLCPAYYDGW
jgi:hypothetical protein